MSYSEAAGDKREINMIIQVFSTFKDFAETREASSLSFSTITVTPELQANRANLAALLIPPCYRESFAKSKMNRNHYLTLGRWAHGVSW